MVVAYVKQETLEPVRGLGRFLGFGLAGSMLVGVGQLLFLLGVLRLLQAETGSAFEGHLSFVPYLVVVVACGGVAAAAMSAKNPKERR